MAQSTRRSATRYTRVVTGFDPRANYALHLTRLRFCYCYSYGSGVAAQVSLSPLDGFDEGMTHDWREYQEQAARFFTKMGLSARVGATLEGARGIHEIDVYVEGRVHGIHFKWVIECKAWKTNVTKEKVMALSAIVQDIGADRGFLLSETGFQSGAIRAAQRTNMTLTSLEELTDSAEEAASERAISALAWRIQKAQKRLRDLKRQQFDDDYYPPMLAELGRLLMLNAALEDALTNKFPSVYMDEKSERRQAASLDELLVAAESIVRQAEEWQPPRAV